MAAVLYGSGSVVGSLRCHLPVSRAMRARTLSCQLSPPADAPCFHAGKHGIDRSPRDPLDSGLKGSTVPRQDWSKGLGRSGTGIGRAVRRAVPCRAVGVGTVAAAAAGCRAAAGQGCRKSSESVTHLSHHARPGRIPAAQSLATHHDRTPWLPAAGGGRWHWPMAQAEAEAGPLKAAADDGRQAGNRRKRLAQHSAIN